jgi:hypothetical protein
MKELRHQSPSSHEAYPNMHLPRGRRAPGSRSYPYGRKEGETDEERNEFARKKRCGLVDFKEVLKPTKPPFEMLVGHTIPI